MLENWRDCSGAIIMHSLAKHHNIPVYYEDRQNAVKTSDQITTLLNGRVIETRIFNNWLSVLSVYSTLNDQLDFPWDYHQTLSEVVELIVQQNNEIKQNDDPGPFWKIIQYLISSNIMYEGGDYKIRETNSVTRKFKENNKWAKQDVTWIEPKQVLWISTSRVFSLYKHQCGREGDKPLPDSTILYYLRNSPAFLFETKKGSFKKIDPKSGMQVEVNGEKKRTCTTALVFDLGKLDLNISSSEQDTLAEIGKNTTNRDNISNIKIEKTPDQELPF